jgi:uncharacterized protein YbcI
VTGMRATAAPAAIGPFLARASCGKNSDPGLGSPSPASLPGRTESGDEMISTTRDESKDAAPSMAKQIARAARDFEQQRTGLVPQSVTVVLSDGTLVIALHGVLSQAERDLARSPAGAARVQEFHRELFLNSCAPLRQAIERITGVEVREATVDVEPAAGAVVRVFSSGTVVQVFLLAGLVEADTWGGSGPDVQK